MPINLDCVKKTLTQQETKDLTEKARNGDKQAREELITSNCRLIFRAIELYFNRYPYPKEDLFGYGVLGLIEAIEHFDPKRGNFSTCAFVWIRQRIIREVNQNEFLVARIPEHKTYGEQKAKNLVPISLSKPLSSSGLKKEKTVEDTLLAYPKDLVEKIFFSETLSLLKKGISSTEYALLYKRFCLDMTLEKTGEELAISRQWTEKKIKGLIKKSRKILKRAGITSVCC